jgi:hypothetical protein
MNKSSLIASILTVLFVMGLVAYRLLWAGSQLAAGAGLRGLPGWLPQTWRRWIHRWIFGERGTLSSK